MVQTTHIQSEGIKTKKQESERFLHDQNGCNRPLIFFLNSFYFIFQGLVLHVLLVIKIVFVSRPGGKFFLS